MTAAQLRKHPLSTYQRAYQMLVEQEQCYAGDSFEGHRLDYGANEELRSTYQKHTGAGAFEHLQHALIGGQPLVMDAFSNEEWCARYQRGCGAASPRCD